MNGETILCIAPRNWRSLWRESQQIMSRMARQNRVLYFEPGRDGNEPILAEMSRNWSNFFTVRGQTLHENLIVLPSPARLPIGRRHLPRRVLEVTTPWVVKANNTILVRHVRHAMKLYNVKDPILWLYSPYHGDLVGKFGEKLACYHNYDEFPDMVPNARVRDVLRQFDNRLSSRVDVVFATSRAQWQRRRAVNPDSYFVPNGVNFDLFNRALSANLPLPADLASVPRPIIGFAGWLGYHIDVDLLYRVAETYADCSLVLVGPDQLPDTATRQRLRNRPNVFFLGQKEPEHLPNYLQVFDVALMPYLLNEGHVRSAYPLKLHEYLAAGRPIVTVALPEVQPFSSVIRMAETPGEFIRDIGRAFGDHDSEAIQGRVAVAKENTWDHRVAEMYHVLERHLSAPATRSRSAKGSHVSRGVMNSRNQPDTLSGALDYPQGT